MLSAQWKNADKVMARFGKFSTEAPKVSRKVIEDVAFQTKKIGLATFADAIGSDLVLSGMGRKGRGVKVRVWYDIKGKINPTAVIRPVPPGPASLVESGSKSTYPILARKARAKNRRGHSAQRSVLLGESGRGFLGNPKTGFAASSPVWHPAQRGKHPWEKARRLAALRARKMWTHAQRRAYAELLTGR